MTKFTVTRRVPFSADQIYSIAVDVAAYKEFLPLMTGSTVGNRKPMPGGGTPAKPVGLVHIAAARRGAATLHRRLMLGEAGRERVRLASVEAALQLAAEAAAGTP